VKLSDLKPAYGSKEKRTRVGRGHGSGMVKTSGKGGKGQTARSGGGKGPNFEGGQTPWFRRLPQRRGVSQKARSTVIFRTEYAVINLADLASWEKGTVITPQSLLEAGFISKHKGGVKVDPHDAELGFDGGERIIGDLRTCCRHGRQQR